MNKSAIQKFSIQARIDLKEQVAQRCYQYGITKDGYGVENAVTVMGRALSNQEQEQRWQLIQEIKKKGYDQVIEEVAYTWFNRFIALRFMEVNNYLPSHVRVFSDSTGAFKPEILSNVIHLDLPGLDMAKVTEYVEKNQTEELYRYLLLTQCNALNEALPRMFEKMGGYTELLLPNNILRPDSVLGRMVSDIPEEDWTDQVQIIGWLYQYYNAELKDETFALLKKNVKITKERIPSATQLFTPDWIVRYMVENSLGRLWVEGHPDDALKAGWKYYLEEAEQEPEVQEQLKKIRDEYATITPLDIKVIDPCMGSGHILVYAFDVLVQIYKASGYSERDAAKLILENNLYGLDIDDRAAQLAYFAVMMKARQYDRRIFSRGVEPHIYAIQESNNINRRHLKFFGWQMSDLEQNLALNQLNAVLDEFKDAKEYGSILNISKQDWELLYRFVLSVDYSGQMTLDAMGLEDTKDQLFALVKIAAIMAQKYDVVVTNPPYMGGRSYSNKLGDKILDLYPDGKQDLFSVFILRCTDFAKVNRFVSMITMHSFMFLASFEKMRYEFLNNNLVSLIHLGIKAFDEIGNDVVQTASYVFRKQKMNTYNTTFCRLVDSKDQQLKKEDFENRKFLSNGCISDFLRIPGATLAYWVSDAFIENYERYPALSDMIEMSSLNKTGDNDTYLRYWWEVPSDAIGDHWVFYSKGGNFRRYYGNIDVVIDWSESARWFYKNNKTSNLVSEEYWYREGITYSAVTSRGTGFRYLPQGCVYDMGGPAIFVKSGKLISILALLNSSVATYYFNVMNPSINLQTKDIKQLPVILDSSGQIEVLATRNMELAQKDWDSVETSHDFDRFTSRKGSLSLQFEEYIAIANNEAEQFALNLAQINERYATLYGIPMSELPPLEERDNAIAVPNEKEWIRSLISYAVGCMFGRYSLNVPGLAYAGGQWDASKYSTIIPEKDNIIPICDDDYFDDDITARFIRWVETVYGKDTLEENLKFIANALGGKGQPREVIRNYFLNDFYADHLKIYQKRPIYWLFDSGKKNGFKALIYMHRYQSDLLARMRTDYVHEMQERYRTQLQNLSESIATASGAQKVNLNRQLKKVQEQSLEIQKYEEKIHHLADQNIKIDLDDGVKHNYALFADVLAKIK